MVDYDKIYENSKEGRLEKVNFRSNTQPDNRTLDSKQTRVLELIEQAYNDKTNYAVAQEEYLEFIKNYTNKRVDGNNLAKFNINGNIENGILTNKKYFLSSDTDEYGYKCNLNESTPLEIGGNDINDSSKNNNTNMKYGKNVENSFVYSNENYKGQPCGNTGRFVHIIKPYVTNDVTTIQDEGCYKVNRNHLYEQKDMGDSVNVRDCAMRAKDLGSDIFSLSKFDSNTKKGGICHVGNDLESIKAGSTIVEKKIKLQGVGNPGYNNVKLTLRKNGNLVLWNCENNSCVTSDNRKKGNDPNPYDDSSDHPKMLGNIIWESISHGGNKIDSCHPKLGGSINNIDASWGANCDINPESLLPNSTVTSQPNK